jgi:hypothetical protein
MTGRQTVDTGWVYSFMALSFLAAAYHVLNSIAAEAARAQWLKVDEIRSNAL